MVNEAQVQQLISLGMGRYEARAYLALLFHDEVASAAEVSDLADVPRQRVYDVLAGLRDQGLVVTKDGRPMRYMALDPNLALRAYLETRRQQHQTEIAFLESQVEMLVSELALDSDEQLPGPDGNSNGKQEPLGGF